MPAALARVREEHRPTVAFLPISRMEYSVADGGVNGFCRYVDTTMLTRSFQYTAGPKEAVQWVRELDVQTVVPYATFTFNPRATPGEVAELLAELRAVGPRRPAVATAHAGRCRAGGPRRVGARAAAAAAASSSGSPPERQSRAWIAG